MNKGYILTSERLGFRSWSMDDLDAFAEMNANPDVMRHFPKTLSRAESAEFLGRLQVHHQKHGYCYFAAELLESGKFIGFIGLAYQDYSSEYTPSVDIGWRLRKDAWGRGYATEGARQCLNYAFTVLELERVIATCTLKNKASERVMQKIGMQRLGEFKHPRLHAYPDYESCVCYEIKRVRT